MLIIATATTPADQVTHHLVRADTGGDAYRRLRPLLTCRRRLPGQLGAAHRPTLSLSDRSTLEPRQEPHMTAEAWTIIGTGTAIAVMFIGLIAWLRTDMKDRLSHLEAGQSRLEDGQQRIESRLLAVENQQARTSGLLEGLGLTGRAQPAPGAGD